MACSRQPCRVRSESGFCCWLQRPRLHSLCKEPTHPIVSCLLLLDVDKGPAGQASWHMEGRGGKGAGKGLENLGGSCGEAPALEL